MVRSAIVLFLSFIALLFFYQNCGAPIANVNHFDSSDLCLTKTNKQSTKQAQSLEVIQQAFLSSKIQVVPSTSDEQNDYTLLVDYRRCNGLPEVFNDFPSIMTAEKEQLEYGQPNSYWAYDVVLSSTEVEQLSLIINDYDCIIGLEATPKKAQNFAFTVNDNMYNQQEHLNDSKAGSIDFEKAMDLVRSEFGSIQLNNKVVIAQIGEGVDGSHPDLSQNMWRGQNNLYGHNFLQPGTNPTETPRCGTFCTQEQIDYFVGHDTHIAGLMSARTNNSFGVTGIGHNTSQIMAIKTQGNYSQTVNAINWAVDNGADVINLSLGFNTTNAGALDTALRNAIASGVFISMAAGNYGNATVIPPASLGPNINGAISVGSVDADSGQISCFSSRNPGMIEIGAVGAKSGPNGICENDINHVTAHGLMSTGLKARPNIYPDYPPSIQHTYRRVSGTSMSAPIVAASAAWLIAVRRMQGALDPAPHEIETLLKTHADRINSLNQHFQNGRRLNLFNLLSSQISEEDPESTPTPTPTPTPRPEPSPSDGPTPDNNEGSGTGPLAC